MNKLQISEQINTMYFMNTAEADILFDKVSLRDYSHLVRDGIWTDAINTALREHEVLHVPASDTPYLIDGSIIVPSNRKIIADEGAVIKQCEEVRVLMLRNENPVDGTHYSIKGTQRDCNITIIGGRWEEYHRARAGYGKSGMYDEDRSFYGVSTCMLFNNVIGLTLKNMTFAHTGGFAVQIGEIKNAVFENITFDSCYADGIHINGNSERILARNISGQVGDDLVALNMYDWQDSSVNFGPIKTVVCEHLDMAPSSPYKALRIEPGTYYFDDGSSVDCALFDAVIRDVKGVNTFKMYFQTPPYAKDATPERGTVGSVDNVYFEDIKIDLTAPIDELQEYMESDPTRGSFAGFELGANIGNLHFKNIDIKLYRDKYPYCYLLCIGPKSAHIGDLEIFDPHLSSTAQNITFENITVNGETCRDITPFIREISFESIGGGKGIIQNLRGIQ